MSESKHTPGLKLADVRGTYRICTSVGNPLVEFKAASAEGGARYEELCRLFASSPELLEACRWAADTLICDYDNDDPCTAHPKIREEDCNPCGVRRVLWAAISKAVQS